MFILRLVVFLMAMATLSGSFVLIVLVAPIGLNNPMGIIGAVAVGTIVAVPVAYIVAAKMAKGMRV